MKAYWKKKQKALQTSRRKRKKSDTQSKKEIKAILKICVMVKMVSIDINTKHLSLF